MEEKKEAVKQAENLSRTDRNIRKNLEFLADLPKDLTFIPEVATIIARNLPDLKSSYYKGEIIMAVMGEFSVGKSTLINAILGQNVLTAKILPTTAILTYIHYGSVQKALVFYPDGQKKAVSFNRLEPYLTGQEKIKSMHLYFPNQLLKQGLTIIDTPGSNVENEEHLANAHQAIIQANACLYVFNGQQPFSRSSAAYLAMIRQSISKFVFVMNKADELEPDEIEDALQYARGQIAKEMNQPEIDLLPVSSLKALNGDRQGSNFQQLWDTLFRMMKNDKNRIIIEKIFTLQQQLLNRVYQTLKSKESQYEAELQRILGKEITVAGLHKEALATADQSIAKNIAPLKARYLSDGRGQIELTRQKFISQVTNIRSLKKLAALAPSIDSDTELLSKYLEDSLESNIKSCYSIGLDSLRNFFALVFADLKKVSDQQRKQFKFFLKVFLLLATGSLLTLGIYSVWGTTPALITTIIWLIGLLIFLKPKNIERIGLASLKENFSIYSSAIGFNMEVSATSGTKAVMNYGGFGLRAGIRSAVMTGNPITIAIGAVAGGVIGGIVSLVKNIYNNFKYLDKEKAKVFAAIDQYANGLETMMVKTADIAFESSPTRIKSLLSSQIDDVMKDYQETLNRIMAKQTKIRTLAESQKDSVKQAIQKINSCIEEIHQLGITLHIDNSSIEETIR